MQPVTWYLNRLKTMSPTEIVWRVSSLVKGVVEAARVEAGVIAKPNFTAAAMHGDFAPGYRITDVDLGCWSKSNKESCSPVEASWLQALCAKADGISNHKISLFNLHNQFLGNPINWNRDHNSDIQAPIVNILKVDYRDLANFGDCKLVWEPNRHHQLVVLGRAYKATGETRYAQAVVDQLESWMRQNPYGKGMNWRSPLELGIRLINWVWAIDLILDSGLFRGGFQQRLIHSVYLHLRDVGSKFSQGTSANNHLVGEVAGVFIAASYFNLFKECDGWINQSYQILHREIRAQSYRDGCTREQALGYQFFVIQFYLFSALIGGKTGRDFSADYWAALQKLFLFIAKLAEGGPSLPMFGDRDDGYVLDLGDRVHDINALMSLGQVLFKEEAVFASLVSAPAETVFWLYGRDKCFAALQNHVVDQTLNQQIEKDRPLTSHRFDECGYFLLQHGRLADKNKVSVLIDCAELGYTNIAAHGHADALSFALRLNDLDLFVDPGTYDYFTYPTWRQYFRKTRAHNTVEVDGEDQSVMQGPFMWSEHAQAICKSWNPTAVGGVFVGEHTGYQRFLDPLTHQREYLLQGDENYLEIKDTLKCLAGHQVALYFHLSEHAKLQQLDGTTCSISLGGVDVKLQFDEALKITSLEGSENPPGGWLSRGYHQKIPVVTLIASATITGTQTFTSRISW